MKLSGILRAVNRDFGDINILTGATHEAYETNLAKTGFNFYAISGQNIKSWNTKYRPRPKNYHELNSTVVPDWLRVDLVLSQHKFGQYQVLAPIARQLGVPLISLEHTLPPEIWNDSTRLELRKMHGDIDVFISNYSIKQWGFDKDIVPGRHIGTVEHGIDTEVFRPNENIKREDTFLSVVNDWKNRDYFCGYRLWEGISGDLPTVVVGDNPGLSESAKDIDELVSYYQKSRYFINTSLVSPVPTSLMEAMASGCTVITTNTCMIPELVVDGYNGMLCSSPQEMIDKIRLVREDKELAIKLGENARKTIVEKYSLERFIKNWTDTFEFAFYGIY